MSARVLLLLIGVTAMGLAACERKAVSPFGTPAEVSADVDAMSRTQASGALATAVDAYAKALNPENDAAVRKAMADVDAELAELEELLAKRQGHEREKVASKYRRLEAYRSEQTTRFAEAQQAGTGLVTPETQGTGAR